MSIDALIKTTCNKAFSKYLYSELVIGQLAHTEFKDGKGKGNEVDVIMPGTVHAFGYTGGDLPEAKEADTSIAKIKLDKGYAFHFKINAIKKQQILNAKTPEAQIDLAKEYAMDATKKAASFIDAAYAELYTRAGHYLADTDGGAIELTPQNAVEILAYMKAKMMKNKQDKLHTSWVEGEMIAILPPEYQYYLGLAPKWDYTESGQKKLAKGYVGHIEGWDILSSNLIAEPEPDVFMPLFGRKGNTLAGGVCKDFSLISYIPEKNFDETYKGYGMFGVGAPRSDLFGAAKIKCPLKLNLTNNVVDADFSSTDDDNSETA